MYGLPQARIIANKLLKQCQAKHDYYQVPFMPELLFMSDDFGIKYVGEKYTNHLLIALQQDYTVDNDRSGKLYWGITLQWDYNNRMLDVSVRICIGFTSGLLH